MIEPIMYFCIGFLAAALIALLFFPLVHDRAVRLTMRRLEAATPLTIAEIRADKDQLRAGFAMATRRLEMSVEQMKAKTTAQLAELGKKTDAINQLKRELGEKTATIFAFEERDKTLIEQMRTTEEEYELKSSSLRETERVLGEKEAELSKLIAEIGDQSISADSQRVELAALRAQVEAMKISVSEYERTIKETGEQLARERNASTAAKNELTDARGKLEGLNTRTAELEKQLAAQTGEAGLLNKRIQEMEGHLTDQGQRLAVHEQENQRLRGESEAARKNEGDLRGELAAVSSNVADKFKANIEQLQAQLAAAALERTKLQAEIAKLQQEAEATNVVRDRVNTVAAEVARLTAALDGPDSPIATLIANGGAHGANGSGKAGSAGEQKGTLADRIRALQSSAARRV
jgi:predicted  nucleic acid-binding Zn-ribbon protein